MITPFILLNNNKIQNYIVRQLTEYLEEKVFAGQEAYVMEPDVADVEGFEQFMARYSAGLPIERAAVDNMK